MIDRLDTEPPRSRLPMLLGALVAVVAIIAATIFATSLLGGEEDPVVPPTSGTATASGGNETSPTSPVSGGNGSGADGCLGGINPSASVLNAQKNAPLSAKGAAGFAGTFMRWFIQYPADEKYGEKAGALLADDAGSDLTNPKPREAGPEDSAWGTTDGARYRVVEVSDDSATVELLMPAFIDSTEVDEPAEVEFAARWRLKAVEGKWRVADLDGIQDNDPGRTSLEAEGLTFKGVC